MCVQCLVSDFLSTLDPLHLTDQGWLSHRFLCDSGIDYDGLRHVSLLFHCTRHRKIVLCFVLVLVFLFWFLPLPMPRFFRFPRILCLPFLILSPWLLLL
jgi:hypothetical protein